MRNNAKTIYDFTLNVSSGTMNRYLHGIPKIEQRVITFY